MTKRANRLSDTLLEDLRQANPVGIDALPSSGDREAAQTLEEIVRSVASTLAPERDKELVSYFASVRRWRRGFISLAAAAIVVAAVGVAVFAIDFGTAPSATAAVHSAAASSVGDSVRWETRVTIGMAQPDEPLEFSIAGTVSGDNAEIIWRSLSDLSALGLPEVGPLRVVIVDGEVYLSFAEGSWEGPQPASEFPFLSAITADAMIGDLQQLTGFSKVGDEDVDGEQWTRYQTEAAPNDAIRSILVLTLGVAQISVDAGPSEAAESALLNVWVDGDNLIRRVSFGAGTVSAGSFTAVTDFDGSDEPVEITRPAA